MSTRGLLRPHWTPIVLGLLMGLIASSGIVYAWNGPYNREPSLYLLGSGKGLSALVTIDRMRVLIVSGDDPIGFSNALAGARPLTAPRIDLLIVTPGSDRIASRATSITDPGTLLEIAGPDGNVIAPEAKQITSVATISLGNGMELIIDPGVIVGSALPGWSVTIHAGSSTLLLAERQPIRAPAGIAVLAVMGSNAPLASVPAPAPMALSASIAEGYGDTTWPIGLIDPGESARIRIDHNAIRLPGSWEQKAIS